MEKYEQGVRETLPDLLYAMRLLKKLAASMHISVECSCAVRASIILLKAAIKSQEKIALEFADEEKHGPIFPE